MASSGDTTHIDFGGISWILNDEIQLVLPSVANEFEELVQSQRHFYQNQVKALVVYFVVEVAVGCIICSCIDWEA